MMISFLWDLPLVFFRRLVFFLLIFPSFLAVAEDTSCPRTELLKEVMKMAAECLVAKNASCAAGSCYQSVDIVRMTCCNGTPQTCTTNTFGTPKCPQICVFPLVDNGSGGCLCPQAMGGGTPTNSESGSATQCTCAVGTAGAGMSMDVGTPEYMNFSTEGKSCSNPNGVKCPDGSLPDTSTGFPTCGGSCQTKSCVGPKYMSAPNPETCECGLCENGEPIIWSSPTAGVCAGADEPTICDKSNCSFGICQ